MASKASKAWEIPGPTSPFALHLDQRYLLIPELELTSGEVLINAPVAFKTYGKLNERGTNAIVVCHAVSGNALAAEWWDTLVGPGKVIDTDRFFVVCCNALGSPYGSASPVTRRGGELINNGEWRPAPFVHASESQTEKTWWGSDFPQTTLRDDVQYVITETNAKCTRGSLGLPRGRTSGACGRWIDGRHAFSRMGSVLSCA